MYEACWKRLTLELSDMTDKGITMIDGKLLLAYMTSLEELYRLDTKVYQLERRLDERNKL